MAQMELLWAPNGSNTWQAKGSSRGFFVCSCQQPVVPLVQPSVDPWADIQNAKMMATLLDLLPAESCCHLKLKQVHFGVRRGLQAHLHVSQCVWTRGCITLPTQAPSAPP